MQAIEVREPGALVLQDAEEPRPGPGEVLVEVELVGICGTDIHVLDGHFPAARYPARPGHEVTGIVTGGGPGIRMSPGQRVCIDPGLPCGRCRSCRAGRHNLCLERRALGISLPGGAAELMVLPESNCYPISGAVLPERAVLCEPLACVIHAVDRVPGSPAVGRAVVYGAGTVGLLATQVLDHLGARRVDVIDPNEERHELAQKLASGEVAGSAAEFGEPEWDLVVDASGALGAVQDGLGRVGAGGTYVQLGVAPYGATVALQPFEVFARELTIVGSMTTSYSFDRAVAYLENEIVDVSGFTGQQRPLADYAEAIRAARSGDDIKSVVRPTRGVDRSVIS